MNVPRRANPKLTNYVYEGRLGFKAPSLLLVELIILAITCQMLDLFSAIRMFELLGSTAEENPLIRFVYESVGVWGLVVAKTLAVGLIFVPVICCRGVRRYLLLALICVIGFIGYLSNQV